MYGTIKTGRSIIVLFLLLQKIIFYQTHFGTLMKFLHILKNFFDTHKIYYAVSKV